MFDKIKNIFKKPEPVKTEPKPKKPRKPKEPKTESVLSEKEKATMAGEPYIAITKVDVDPNDMHNGAFELDWNDKFVLNLIKSGYKQRDDDTDNIIVDRWFQVVCRNIALEVYEQVQADPTNRDIRPIQTRDLGNGRTEVS
jgi:hypothetical protein